MEASRDATLASAGFRAMATTRPGVAAGHFDLLLCLILSAISALRSPISGVQLCFALSAVRDSEKF